jgi:DNA-binding GntR family transcriptional regulator
MVMELKTSPVASVKNSHKSLTDATVDELREAIRSGKFPPSSQLPPELELMTLLGVSRTTLREALRTLEEQQLIQRKRGLGTFVCERSIVKDLSTNFGISEMIRQAGLTPGSRNAFAYTKKAWKDVAEALQIRVGEAVVVIDRVRTADQRPVVWSLDILPASILDKSAIETFDWDTQSLYGYLEEKLNIRIAHGRAQLRPVPASIEMAAKLNVRAGTPLMNITQTDFDANDHPILHSIEYHLPNAFVFVFNRRGPNW